MGRTVSLRLMRQRGFTLIEIVVVMLVLAILIAMAAALTRGVMAGQKRSLTVTRIQTVDAALVQFESRSADRYERFGIRGRSVAYRAPSA